MKTLKPGYIVEVKSLNNQKMIVVGLNHKSRMKNKAGEFIDKWEDVFRLARICKDGEANAIDLKRWSRFQFNRSDLKYVGRTIFAALQE